MSQKKPRPRLFERLKAGLEEIILYAEGKKELKTFVIEISDAPPPITKDDVIALRNRLQMTELAFARLLNVSLGTVGQWEAGKRKPTGAAARLLQVYAERPDTVESLTAGQDGTPPDAPRPQRARTRT
jgi:putative transcriptional regulator